MYNIYKPRLLFNLPKHTRQPFSKNKKTLENIVHLSPFAIVKYPFCAKYFLNAYPIFQSKERPMKEAPFLPSTVLKNPINPFLRVSIYGVYICVLQRDPNKESYNVL